MLPETRNEQRKGQLVRHRWGSYSTTRPLNLDMYFTKTFQHNTKSNADNCYRLDLKSDESYYNCFDIPYYL